MYGNFKPIKIDGYHYSRKKRLDRVVKALFKGVLIAGIFAAGFYTSQRLTPAGCDPVALHEKAVEYLQMTIDGQSIYPPKPTIKPEEK